MTARTLLPALVCAALAWPAAPARADDATVLQALLGSEKEASGDFDAWIPELLSAVESDPESAYALAAVWKVRNLAPHSTDPTVIEQRLGPLLARGVRDGETLEAIQDLLAGRARARGEFEAADLLGGNDGYVTRFAVAGPFGTSNAALVHRPFPPEAADLDPTAPMKGARGPAGWLTIPQLGSSPWVSPYSQIRQGGGGVAYAMARLRPDRARTVAVKVWCSDSFALLVNGRRAFVTDRTRDRAPNPVWTTIRLEDGWNRVLVKIAGRGSFALKLVDPATGLPALDVEAGDPLLAAAPPAPAADPAERTYHTPLERALAAVDSGPAPAYLRAAAAAVYLQDRQRDWEAFQMWKRAAGGAQVGAAAVAQANVLAAYGRFVAEFGELPPVYRKLRAKEQFEAALAARPGHNSAVVRLASYQDEDDHPDEAVTALRDFMAKSGPTVTALMRIAEISGKRGWEREAIDSAEAAASMAPNYPAPIRFLANYDRRYGNHKAVLTRSRQLLAIDAADESAYDEILRVHMARGEHEEALALLRELSERWPGSLRYRGRMAGTLRNLGRYDQALAIWRELERLVPDEDTYPREIGEILELQDDEQAALDAYERSLERQPYQPTLWRVVTRLRGGIEDFAKRYEPNVEELIAALPPDEELKAKYPKAVAVTVLDHSTTLVRPDGSHSTIVHMVYKLLDEKAVAKYGDLQSSGELLDIRTIQPNGEVWEPTGLRRSSFNLEGLVPGSVVNHRYLTHGRAAPEGFNFGKFYFQDFQFRRNPNPVVLSRWVVLTPDGMELSPEKGNYPEEPEVSQADGLTATVWAKRDMPRIEYEQNMPGEDEIVPYVEYATPVTMADANSDFLAARADSRSSPLLDEALAAVVTPEMGDTEKLHAIYDFVNTEITGDFGSGSGSTSILLEKAGNRAQLFETLIRSAGIPYRQGRAMPWNGDGRDMTQPTSTLYSTPFLWLEPHDSEPVAFFMGSRQTPFGLVPEQFRGSSVFLAAETGGEIRELAAGGAPLDDTTEFDIHLGADAATTRVEGSLHYRSPNGYRFKRSLMEMSQDDRRKFAEGQVTSYFANPALDTFEFPRLDEKGAPLEVRVAGTMAQYLSSQGDGYVVSLGFPASRMTARFVHRPERTYDLIVRPRDDGVDQVTIHLGDAFEVAALPEDHLAVHEIGTYSLTWRHEGDRVTARREVHLKPARYKPDAYRSFVKWCKAVDDAEERKLELRTRS